MTADVFGVDSYREVTEDLIAQAQRALGAPPRLWGRYFTSRTLATVAEYDPARENVVLARHGIRVVPLARQTPHVGGSRQLGYADGLANGMDVISTFGKSRLLAMSGVRVFLDVEGPPLCTLSADYYVGWSSGLLASGKGVSFLPCVSGTPNDVTTWQALRGCVACGAPCHGVWLSRTDEVAISPITWPIERLAPLGIGGDVPVCLWQFSFGTGLGLNLWNPNLDPAAAFLETLVLPPPTSSPPPSGEC